MTTTLTKLAALEGLITADVGEYLYEAAKHIPEDLAVVEIGAWKGKSTCYLAAGRRDGIRGHVYSVDPWSKQVNDWSRYHVSASLNEWEEQVANAGFAGAVSPLRGKSAEVAANWGHGKIGLLYIDGDHARQAVIEDFESWRPFLANGATVIFDDYGVSHNPDVAPVVHELATAGEILNLRIEANGRIAVGEVA